MSQWTLGGGSRRREEETHQNCLSIREVKGRLEGGKETGGHDVLVDEVWEADQPVFTSCTHTQ